MAVHRETLLVRNHVADVVVLLFLAPSDREWVVGPETDRRHVEISVLARAECPRASHADGNTKRITREDLDLGLGTTVANIALDEAEKTPGALEPLAPCS